MRTAALPDRFYAMADGVLTGWDRSTGAPVGPPTDLATDPQRREWFAGAGHGLQARPGHPGEVAVLGPGNTIELWDLARGTQGGTLPLAAGRQTYAFAFDGTGSRLAAVTTAGTLDVWDLERQELINPGIPIEGSHHPVGFTADGMIVTAASGQGGHTTLTFWDPAAGRSSGTIRLTVADHTEAEIVGGTWLDVEGGAGFTAASSGAVPVTMALTPQQWAGELCRVAGHPFTEVERAALPEGSSIDPPC